jgi:hypothetical protein
MTDNDQEFKEYRRHMDLNFTEYANLFGNLLQVGETSEDGIRKLFMPILCQEMKFIVFDGDDAWRRRKYLWEQVVKEFFFNRGKVSARLWICKIRFEGIEPELEISTFGEDRREMGFYLYDTMKNHQFFSDRVLSINNGQLDEGLLEQDLERMSIETDDRVSGR